MRALLVSLVLVVASLLAGEASAQSEFIKGPCQAHQLAEQSCAPVRLGQQALVYTTSSSATDCTVYGTTLALCVYNGTKWIGFIPGVNGGLSADSVVRPTADYVMTSCRNGAVSNGAASIPITVTLCAAQKGMDVWAYLEGTQNNFAIDVDNTLPDMIRAPEVGVAGSKLQWTCSSGSPCPTGSAVHLISFDDGRWTVVEIKGATPANGGP